MQAPGWSLYRDGRPGYGRHVPPSYRPDNTASVSSDVPGLGNVVPVIDKTGPPQLSLNTFSSPSTSFISQNSIFSLRGKWKFSATDWLTRSACLTDRLSLNSPIQNINQVNTDRPFSCFLSPGRVSCVSGSFSSLRMLSSDAADGGLSGVGPVHGGQQAGLITTSNRNSSNRNKIINFHP